MFDLNLISMHVWINAAFYFGLLHNFTIKYSAALYFLVIKHYCRVLGSDFQTVLLVLVKIKGN